jgi:hypothetical protein
VSNAMRNSYASHTDFGFLRGLFEDSPKIMPSNLDMVYGINDKFLLGEWKRDNEEISEGQKILLKALSKEPNFTVILINGYSDNTGIHISKYYQISQTSLIYLGNSIDSLKDYIKTWYKLAKRI